MPLSTPSNGLILLTNGYGAIQHEAWTKDLVIGTNYTVIAVPKGKNVFVNWVGGTSQPYSVLSSSARYGFAFQSNLLLQANFVTNVFLGAQGTYRGLFAPPAALFAPINSARQQTNSGSFLFTVTSGGAISGSLDLGGQPVSFSGKFDLDGEAANIVPRRDPSVTISLQLDFSDQTVSGYVFFASNYTVSAELTGCRDVFSRTSKATEFEGQYTFIIPGTDDPSLGPFGVGYGTVKVDAMGNVTMAGSLADGTAISQSSVVSQNGDWPLYVNLYGDKGSLWGWNLFTNQTLTAPSGLSWINGGNSAKTAAYVAGFTNQAATLTGGIYVPRQALPSALAVTLDTSNGPISPDKLTLKTNVATGLISGSFVDPSTSKTIKVNGVILQGQTNVQGYFLTTVRVLKGVNAEMSNVYRPLMPERGCERLEVFRRFSSISFAKLPGCMPENLFSPSSLT